MKLPQYPLEFSFNSIEVIQNPLIEGEYEWDPLDERVPRRRLFVKSLKRFVEAFQQAGGKTGVTVNLNLHPVAPHAPQSEPCK